MDQTEAGSGAAGAPSVPAGRTRLRRRGRCDGVARACSRGNAVPRSPTRGMATADSGGGAASVARRMIGSVSPVVPAGRTWPCRRAPGSGGRESGPVSAPRRRVPPARSSRPMLLQLNSLYCRLSDKEHIRFARINCFNRMASSSQFEFNSARRLRSATAPAVSPSGAGLETAEKHDRPGGCRPCCAETMAQSCANSKENGAIFDWGRLRSPALRPRGR